MNNTINLQIAITIDEPISHQELSDLQKLIKDQLLALNLPHLCQGIISEVKVTMAITDIHELAEEALNAACLTIQQKLGINDGGYASLFFSDNKIHDIFVKYICDEITNTNK
jgi:hypothetical protein